MYSSFREFRVVNSASSAFSGAGLLCAAAAAGGYAWTATGTVADFMRLIPYGARWWFVVVAAGMAVCALGTLFSAQWHWRSRPILASFLGLLCVVALLLVVTSGTVRAAGTVCWMLLLAYAWGDWGLRLGRAEPSSGMGEWLIVATGLGLAMLALMGLGLGIAGLLRPAPILVVFAALTMGQFRTLRRMLGTARWAVAGWRARVRDFTFDLERTMVVFLGALPVFFGLLWALAPELRYDALNYQLAVPRFYLENARIIDLPYFWHSYFSRLFNLLYTLGMALGGASAAKLLVWATGVAAVCGIYGLAASLGGRRAGMWAAALFAATPFVVWLSATTYVDLPLACFLLACWLAFLRWRETRLRGWLWACGVLAGAVVGTKLNGAYGLPVVGLVVLWSVRESVPPSGSGEAGRSLSARGIDLAGFALGALVVAAPWYALTWAQTGNPVFPLLNGIFRSPGWAPVNQMMNAGLFGVGTSPGGLLRLPFVLTFETDRFDELIPSGGVGPALLLLPASIALLWLRPTRARLLMAGCAVYLALWAFTFQYARYYIPILPLVAALAVGGLMVGEGRLRRGIGLGVLWTALMVQGVLTVFVFGNILDNNPVARLIGRESEGAYLARLLGPYKATEYLNARTKPEDLVIGVGVEYLRFYLRPPLHSIGETRELEKLLWKRATDGEVAGVLARRGYRYLLVNREHPAAQAGLPYLQPSFLESFATLEFQANGAEVYRLLAGE